MKKIKSLPRRADLRLMVISQVGYVSAYLVSPTLSLWLGALLLLAVLLMLYGRLRCAARKTPWPARTASRAKPFISIQIATYSEPPEVVCKTLDTLATLNYPNYEVIVLDNNTPDPALYEPVRRHCQRLGSRFRFFHFDGIEGAKAGALNLATELAHPSTETLLVLDADYCASPELLNEGLSYFAEPDIALVQFPQAYRNCHEDCGLTWEYRHFFNVYMTCANACNTVLSTGTVLFLKKIALQAAGGWPTTTLTEDAELGLRLHQAAQRAVYVPQVTSRGLMPTDLESLRAQRRRWVLGNAQSLRRLLMHPALSARRKAMMFLQLTAWCNPLALCAAGLTTGLLARASGAGWQSLALLGLSATALTVYLVGMAAFFMLASLRHGGSWRTGILSYLVHLGMAWEGAFCWGEIFVEGDKSFIRTSKFLQDSRLAAQALAWIGCGLVAVAIWYGFAVMSSPVVTLCATAMLPLLLGRAVLLFTLERVRCRTVALLEAERRGGVRLETACMGTPALHTGTHYATALALGGPSRSG
jgi:cellulose synthase/poly-beta-1,6-N-acetylglucosamine synthase-like glycosyltransferase